MRLLTVLAVLVVGLAACAPNRLLDADEGPQLTTIQKQALTELVGQWRTSELGGASSVGTAIFLGGGRLLTCRHTLPKEAFGLPPWLKDEPGTNSQAEVNLMAELDGALVWYRVLDAGADDVGFVGDWAVVQVRGIQNPIGPREVTAVFEAEPLLAPGDDIILVGFWQRGDSFRVTADGMCPGVVPARVVKGPSLATLPDEIIPVRTVAKEVLHGMSGGVALVWDGERGRATVVGMYRGKHVLELLGGVWSDVHTIRKLPPAALRSTD